MGDDTAYGLELLGLLLFVSNRERGVAECTVRALAETLAGLNTPDGILPVGIGNFPRGTGKEGF